MGGTVVSLLPARCSLPPCCARFNHAPRAPRRSSAGAPEIACSLLASIKAPLAARRRWRAVADSDRPLLALHLAFARHANAARPRQDFPADRYSVAAVGFNKASTVANSSASPAGFASVGTE